MNKKRIASLKAILKKLITKGRIIKTYKIIANNKLKDKSILYNLRRQMVEYYEEIKSFRKTALKFNVNVKTIIKWVKRYKLYGLSGLLDIKRAPKRIHNKLSENIEKILYF